MAQLAQLRVGGYRIIRKLAVGGMAEIFLAQLEADHGFTKQVVIKRLLPHLCDDADFVAMFLHEARLAAHLNHPNIAQVFDIGESEGRIHYAMEYVHGPDLRTVARRMHAAGEGPRLELVVGVCIGAAAGLHHAHTARDELGRPLAVVHRDVTPSNVVVTYGGVPKLLDFGVAKASLEGRESTAVGVIKGKLPYMSPEQIDTSVRLDGRSDVFSLGVMLWELTTLRRLYRCPSQIETIRRITGEDAPPPSSVCDGYPPALEPIVMRALARDRNQRYASAHELQRALEVFAVDHRLVVSGSAIAGHMSELFADELEDERARLANTPREVTNSGVFTHLGEAPRGSSEPAGARLELAGRELVEQGHEGTGQALDPNQEPTAVLGSSSERGRAGSGSGYGGSEQTPEPTAVYGVAAGSAGAAPDAGASESLGAGFVAMRPVEAEAARRRPWGWIAGLGLGALALALLGFGLGRGSRSSDERPVEDAAKPARIDAPAAIGSTPSVEVDSSGSAEVGVAPGADEDRSASTKAASAVEVESEAKATGTGTRTESKTKPKSKAKPKSKPKSKPKASSDASKADWNKNSLALPE